jgi:hypothetical protein
MSPGRITGAIANPYSGRSLSARTRARRWDELLKRFPNLSEMKVVDLGGVERHWTHAPVRPKEVVLVNLPRESNASSMEVVVGDACEPPAELYDRRFDLVYSNSVIEHVGGHARQAAFAKAVRALGDHHWVQTPYRYFPIEPHWLFPGFQFLPVRARVLITPIWPLGHRRATDPRQTRENVLEVDLLSKTQMQFHFPASEIWEERMAGLSKSLVAIG